MKACMALIKDMFYSPKYCGYFYFTLNSKGSKLTQSCTEDKTHLGGVNLINSFDRIKSVAFLFNCLQMLLI